MMYLLVWYNGVGVVGIFFFGVDSEKVIIWIIKILLLINVY